MVQSKQKEPNILEIIKSQSERFNEQNPIIDTRWYVVEVTPGHDTGGYYSEYVHEKTVIVSPYFSTEKDAEDWMSDHLPDQGKHLAVRMQNQRRYIYTQWGV